MNKLDDLPKGEPNSYDEVMKALAVLHKGVLKQAKLYGGKNSKLFIPQVVEDELSLFKAVALQEANDTEKDIDEIDRLLDIVQRRGEDLADHLKGRRDEQGLKHLGMLIRSLSAAISISSKHR